MASPPLLPAVAGATRWDYRSPGLVPVNADVFFPHLVAGDPTRNGWRYLRGEVPHIWYVDDRYPTMGFMNRDEATLLHNIALQFAGKRVLEIGCWMGWSTCHLALSPVQVDVVDPILADPVFRESIEASLVAAGVADRVTLHDTPSPAGVVAAAQNGAPWSLIVVDGDHEGTAPMRDVEASLVHAAADCAFVFHDLTSPDVAEGLRLLEASGFMVLLYQTQQIMGLAWRGNVVPPGHVPDPAVAWQLPHHLVGLPVSGVTFTGYQADLRSRLYDLSRQNLQDQDRIDSLENELLEVRRRLPFRLKRKLRSWLGI